MTTGLDDTVADPATTPEPGRSGTRRSNTDRYLGGVAGGLAQRLDIDPAPLRIGLAGLGLYLALSTPGTHLLAVIPYALAWAFMPDEATGRSLVFRLPDRDAAQELGLVAVVSVVASLAMGSAELLIVAGLGAVAVALLRDRPRRDGGAVLGPTRAGRDPAGVTAGPAAAPALAPPSGWTASDSQARPPRRPRREPALWPLALGLLMILIVGAVAFDVGFELAVDPRIVIDLALVAVGGVMLLSAWRGRARLVLLAVPPLVVLWVAFSAPDIGRFDGEGNRQYRPASLPTGSVEGEPTAVGAYEVGYGTLDIDLTDLDLASGSRTLVTASVTAGKATVRVPRAAELHVRGSVAGPVSVQGPNWGVHNSVDNRGRTFDATYRPSGPHCQREIIGLDELQRLAGLAGIAVPSPSADRSEDEAAEALFDAVADGGFPRPAMVSDYDPSVPPYVEAHLSAAWKLCAPKPPDPDPPVVTIDATIGLGVLEVNRV